MKVGLSGENEPTKNPPFYTLKTLMDKHDHDYIDILKVDVEGAEFDSMTKFMDDFADQDLPVGQLSMELHLDDAYNWNFHKVTDFMERLESFGLRITAYEINLGSTVQGPPKYNEVDTNFFFGSLCITSNENLTLTNFFSTCGSIPETRRTFCGMNNLAYDGHEKTLRRCVADYGSILDA